MNKNAGICLTFDDHFIKEWYDQRSLFRRYNVRATFFICWPERSTSAEIRMLKELRDEGHEIGCHTLSHVRLPKYLKDKTLQNYLDEEIDPAIEIMTRQGLAPTSFSFPYHRFRPRLLAPMLDRFRVLRVEGPYEDEERYSQAIYPRYGNRLLNCYFHTDKTGRQESVRYYATLFKALAEKGGYGVGCGHLVSNHRRKFPKMLCTPEDMETILALADAHGLDFVTMMDLAEVPPTNWKSPAHLAHQALPVLPELTYETPRM